MSNIYKLLITLFTKRKLSGLFTFMLTGLMIQACFHSDDSVDGTSDNLLAVLATGFYSYNIGEYENSYNFFRVVNGKIERQDWDWNPLSKQWVEIIDSANDPNNFIDESQYLQFRNNSWLEGISTDVSFDDRIFNWSSTGDLINPFPNDFGGIGIFSTTSIAATNILASDTNLSTNIEPTSTYKTGSIGYVPSSKIFFECYDFNIGYRYCEDSVAIPGPDGKQTCPGPMNYSRVSLPNFSGEVTTLEQLRASYISLDSSLNYRNYAFYFESGTQNLIIYQMYTQDNWVDLPNPILMTEKGTWQEYILGEKKILELTMPEFSDVSIDPTRNKYVYVEYYGFVYDGRHYLPGFENNRFGDDKAYAWLNWPAMESVLDNLVTDSLSVRMYSVPNNSRPKIGHKIFGPYL